MRPVALALAALLLTAPVSLAQGNQSGNTTNTTDQTPGNQTDDNRQAEDQTNATLEPREDAVPWTGLVLAAFLFVVSVIVARATHIRQQDT